MESNPVHYAAEPTEWEREQNDWNGPGWYFWDEVWLNRIGPFETEAAANIACAEYAENL